MASSRPDAASDAALPAGTAIAEVALAVADLDALAAFYETSIGLATVERDGPEASLGAGSVPFLRLVEDPLARAPGRTARLYHFAVLLPSRADLADAVARVLRSGHRLQGAADHLVSEAVYLDDPEGNGIELYRDRPREAWPTSGSEVGMATEPLDLRALLREAGDGARDGSRAPAGTRVGHVHLQVTDLPAAERFYRDVLGLELRQRYGDQASFLAAGGYHHHVGLNTWGMAGAAPAPADALGLRWYRIAVPGRDAWTALGERLRAHDLPHETRDRELHFRDPAGHAIVVEWI